MAFATHSPPGGAYRTRPLTMAVLGLLALPAIPAIVWCAAWLFKALQAWTGDVSH